MVNVLSKFAAAFLALLLMFVSPLLDSYQKQEKISYNVASQAVTTFVDAARNKGYFTPAMYNDFFQSLHSAGNNFEIEIEHQSKKFVPVYTDAADPGTFQGRTEVHYDAYYTQQILDVLFPDSIAGIDDPSRMYKMEVGDFFTVQIRNMNRTGATILKDFIFNTYSGEASTIYYVYGGMVHNEDY